MNNRLKSNAARIPPATYMMIVQLILFGSMVDNFFSFKNIANILNQSSTLLVLACGQTLIVLMQGTDLSLGFMISTVSVAWIWLLNAGVPMCWQFCLRLHWAACAVCSTVYWLPSCTCPCSL